MSEVLFLDVKAHAMMELSEHEIGSDFLSLGFKPIPTSIQAKMVTLKSINYAYTLKKVY